MKENKLEIVIIILNVLIFTLGMMNKEWHYCYIALAMTLILILLAILSRLKNDK